MMQGGVRTSGDDRPWAPPREGVPVERRDWWEIAAHGLRAGVVAGLALGLVEIVTASLLQGYAMYPFDFAAGLLVGPEAFSPGFPDGAAIALGTVVHLLLSLVLGMVFLGALAVTYQLTARSWLLVVYGVVYGLLVWEVSFLALLPVVAPELTGRVDLATQLWNGLASYCLVYGPILSGYVVRARPGLLDRWWETDQEQTP